METDPIDLFEAIGRVVAESAGLERSYTELVGKMADGHLGFFFTQGAFTSQLQHARDLLLRNQHIPAPWNDRVRTTLLVADVALRDRNDVVHGLWLPAFDSDSKPDPAAFTTHRPVRSSLTDKVRSWSISDLLELAQTMYALRGQMFVLAQNLDVVLRGVPMEPMPWHDALSDWAPVHVPKPPTSGR